VDSGLRESNIGLRLTTLEVVAMLAEPASPHAAVRVDLSAIFVSLEPSKSNWLITSLSLGRETISHHSMPPGIRISSGKSVAGIFNAKS
jgi:hypothetical protein